jgi:protein-L-isoaspartate(D-aspartate) O-methyltransferase
MSDFAELRQRMVDNQIRPSEVTERELIRAFLEVPREAFVAEFEKPFAYADRELAMSPAAPERRMMPPVQLARLIQALPIDSDSRVMTLGCGSGYSAAILARLAGQVVAVEEDESLVSAARRILDQTGADNVAVVHGRLVDGAPSHAPVQAILIDGAIETLPQSLVRQLHEDGALTAIETGERISRAMLYERVGERLAKWPLFEAWASPLPGFERPRGFVF